MLTLEELMILHGALSWQFHKVFLLKDSFLILGESPKMFTQLLRKMNHWNRISLHDVHFTACCKNAMCKHVARNSCNFIMYGSLYVRNYLLMSEILFPPKKEILEQISPGIW